MIEHQIVNVQPRFFQPGQLVSLAFTVLAFDGDLRESADWHTPASLPIGSIQADYVNLAGEIAMKNGLYTQLAAKIKARQDALLPPAVAAKPLETDPTRQRLAWFNQADDLIGTILAKYTRFQMGYIEREAAATAYRARGYTGDASEWITRFADNTHMSYRAASDLILGQAAKLRKAVKDLEDLRMDKYLIMNARTQELAQAEFNRIVRGAEAIASTL